MTIPTDLSYTDQHEWLKVDGDNARVGVTAYCLCQPGPAPG